MCRHSLYKKYNEDVPQYLWNRPKQVVSHCRLSITNAEDIPLKDVAMPSEGKFSIRKRNEKGNYELTFGDSEVPPACQCHSWLRTRLPCKHFFAVFRHYPNWQWDQLSPSYINGPRLTLDEAIITAPGFDNVKPKAIVGNNEAKHDEEIDSIDSGREKSNIKPTGKHCKEMPTQAEKKRRRCRDMLSELRNLTYLIKKNDALNQLEEDLSRILTLAKKRAPSDGGLAIEGQSSLPLHKRSKQGGKNVPVQKKRSKIRFKELPKPIKRKGKYSGRHGSRATMMRQTFQVHVPISTTGHSASSARQPSVSATACKSNYGPLCKQCKAAQCSATACKSNYGPLCKQCKAAQCSATACKSNYGPLCKQCKAAQCPATA